MENEHVGIPLLELLSDGCRYPIDEDEYRHLFCGDPAWTPPGGQMHAPYCYKHCCEAYRDMRRMGI